MKFISLLVVFVVISCIYQNVDSNLIECRTESHEVVISSFDGRGPKNSNIFFCKDDKVIRTYTKCHVNYIKLPVDKIKRSFPSVRIINWTCTGECYVLQSTDEITVQGCTEGKFINFLKNFLYKLLLSSNPVSIQFTVEFIKKSTINLSEARR